MAASLPAGLQGAPNTGQSLQEIRNEHKAEARDCCIERLCFHVQLLSIHHLGRDVAQASLLRRFGGNLQHLSRDVGGQHRAYRPDAFSGQDGLLSRACGHIEDLTADHDVRHVKHDLGCQSDGLRASRGATSPPFSRTRCEPSPPSIWK
jgi:hypothetical protein